MLSFQKDSRQHFDLPFAIFAIGVCVCVCVCVNEWMRGKLWSTLSIKVEKHYISAVHLPFIQSCVITFNDSLLLLFDLSKGQPSGLFRFVDQPGVGRNTSTRSRPFGHQRRPVKHHHNHIYFPKCFIKKLKISFGDHEITISAQKQSCSCWSIKDKSPNSALQLMVDGKSALFVCQSPFQHKSLKHSSCICAF